MWEDDHQSREDWGGEDRVGEDRTQGKWSSF